MRLKYGTGHAGRLVILLLLALNVVAANAEERVVVSPEPTVSHETSPDKFPIRRFAIRGNKHFTSEELNEQLLRYVGRNRTKADIAAARDALELFYRKQGYADAVVKVVEPPPRKMVVVLEVIEHAEPVAVAVTASAPVDNGEETAAPEIEKETATKSGNDEFLLEEPKAQPAQNSETFTIKGFNINGTSLFTQAELQRQVKPFIGHRKTSSDVEGARDALERYFHEQGYPAMMVNIPIQSSRDRIFRLEVIENRIGNVLVRGKRWFSTEKILRDIPSIVPGQVLNLKDLQKEINAANRNPDFKAMPEMLPGHTPGTIDIALKVLDTLPMHGSLELNNRSSHDTTELRLSAALRYDNLWQRDHSISLQYQMSPQAPEEVEVGSASYTLPTPWKHEDKLVVYGVVSNSNTNLAAGYSNLGKGVVIGSRLIIPLQGSEGFFHTAVAGFDYKDFSETVGSAGTSGEKTPITYLPVTAGYNAYLKDNTGLTSITGGISVIFRGAVSNTRQFENKRYKTTGNPLVITGGVERNQQLPGGFTLLAKLDGQLSDQPLISNEEYAAGGVESVRGYYVSEASGDNAIHGVIELSAPELLKQTCKERFTLTPYIFYDIAHLGTREPLPGQNWSADLQGTGFGMRGTLLKDMDFQTDVGFPLRGNTQTKAGDPRVYFKLRYQF